MRMRIASFLLFTVAPPLLCTPASGVESLQRRLLRTIQVGASQDISVEQIRKVAENNGTDYTTEILARSALIVLQKDNAKLITYSELLENVLNHLVSDGTPFVTHEGLPNFRGKETVFTMVYALVMSGNQERAVDILEKQSLTGGHYKQAVVLSALRNIGTPRALSIIQKYAEKGPDRNLAEATLADEDFPVLFEIYDRWSLVPPSERTHDNLRKIVQGKCDQRSAVAAYWLGFLAPNPDPNAEVAERQALQAMIRTKTNSCDMMEHVIALKALALRSAESVIFWKTLAESTPNVWERHQVVIDAFGRWGRAFAPAALEMFKTDDAQYVQWELLNGNLETRQGQEYRNYWDIWIPANVLVTLEYDEAQRRGPMEQKEVDAMLDWLDAGGRPRDAVVLNHTLYHLMEFTSGNDTRRVLQILNALPQRNQNWWILQNLQDRSALPLLNYWRTLPAPKDQQEILEHVINSLAAQSKSAPAGKSGSACCEATEKCLLQHVRENAASIAQVEIRSEDGARKWLADRGISESKYTVLYRDALKRSAVVTSGDGGEQGWEYLYDCWRKTGVVPQTRAH